MIAPLPRGTTTTPSEPHECLEEGGQRQRRSLVGRVRIAVRRGARRHGAHARSRLRLHARVAAGGGCAAELPEDLLGRSHVDLGYPPLALAAAIAIAAAVLGAVLGQE
eukprot:scaffold12703_cov48-Phaeocystis_antarctica.AAC.4